MWTDDQPARQIAADKGCTPAQLALAWLMAQPKCIPIPGTSKAASAFASLELSPLFVSLQRPR